MVFYTSENFNGKRESREAKCAYHWNWKEGTLIIKVVFVTGISGTGKTACVLSDMLKPNVSSGDLASLKHERGLLADYSRATNKESSHQFHSGSEEPSAVLLRPCHWAFKAGLHAPSCGFNEIYRVTERDYSSPKIPRYKPYAHDLLMDDFGRIFISPYAINLASEILLAAGVGSGAIYYGAAFVMESLEAIAQRLTVLDWMIAILLRLQSKTTFPKVLTLLERAWFLLHGSHPPRPITLQRPVLGY